MKSDIKPVVAFDEDVVVWIYYDQIAQQLRYEIFCVGYSDNGQPQTLEFVIEEGILPTHTLPHLKPPQPQSTVLPWIQVGDHFLLLKDTMIQDVHIPHQWFIQHEVVLKRSSKRRIISRLKALGYDVLPTVD